MIKINLKLKEVKMKINYYLTVITLLYSVSINCQTTDIVTMGAGYVNQSFYSLSNGEVLTSNNTNWDISFSLSAYSATIRTNGGMGTTLYKYPNGDLSSWSDVDTLGIDSWPNLMNSEESWSQGSFNTNQQDFDMGWGNYDVITHNVIGHSIYLLNTVDGEWKKLIIEQLVDGVFSFKYANIDGSNEVIASIDQSDYADKNFVYYSLTSDSIIDREPSMSEWDLTFTKYVSQVSPEMYYSVAGALSNKNVEVAEVNDLSDPLSYNEYESQDFLLEMNTIGYDWKTLNMDTFSYELEESRCYFVKNLEGSIYRIVFTDFTGNSSGEITLNKELISGSSVIDVDNNNINSFSVYPNPASDNATIIIDAEADNVQLYICDGSGKKIVETQVSNGFQATNISLSNLESGLYFVSVTFNGATSTQRLVVN